MPLTAEHQHGVSIPKRKREGQRETEAETTGEREANIFLHPTIQMQCRTSETLGRGIKRCEPVTTRKQGGRV